MAPAFDSTVLSLWLPVRDSDEAAMEAGATPDVFRVRVPHTGDALTQLQKDVIRLAEENVREMNLIINKKKAYKKESDHLNTLSRAVGDMYNEWDAEGGDEDEDDEEESDFSEDEPRRKKRKPAGHGAQPYEIPTVTELDKDVVLATHLNRVRPFGKPVRMKPYQTTDPRENYVVVFVTQDTVQRD